mgnify:CR=1 FL=1
MKHFEYTLTPAYGRDYTSVTDVRKDFYDGKDFICNGVGRYSGSYCSIRDIPAGCTVKVRYKKLTEATILEL